jgi:hypothetical protein
VEPLEDRDVPTVLFLPNFGREIVHGRNVAMQNPTVYAIFSGSYWATPQGQADETMMLHSLQNILSGPYLSGLAQYGYQGPATLAGSWTDARTVPVDPNNGANLADVQNFVQESIPGHPAEPGVHDLQHAPIYMVISDPASSAGYNGAWNDWSGTYSARGVPESLHLIWVGTDTWGSSVTKDTFTMNASHELAETISDPTANGISVTPPARLPANRSGDWQICDNEPSANMGSPNDYSYMLNGDLVQPYWSRRDGAFLVPDGNNTTLRLMPIWNSQDKFTGRYRRLPQQKKVTHSQRRHPASGRGGARTITL